MLNKKTFEHPFLNKATQKNLFSNKKRLRNLLALGCFILLLLTTGIFFKNLTLAQSEEAELNKKGAEQLRAELNAQIEELTKQIEHYRGIVREIQSQSKSLEREISLLDNQIKTFELEIRRINLVLSEIESEITQIQQRIKEIEQQSQDEKIVLAELIREIYKFDNYSLLEIILTKEKLSDFFIEIKSLENLQRGIKKSLDEIRALKKELEEKQKNLEDQKNEMIGLRAVQETQKYSIEKKKRERKKILEETRGQEYLYQRLIASKQADVNTIRSKLYVLQGMGGSLKFEEALNIAEFASSVTGVRAALLLAILSRESGLGKNVGTGTWRTDMNPKDHSAYLSICERLGFNPDLMPVSKKAWYGWGGAMGPAQFLPRTWLAYENRIAAVTGHNPPNPWDITDAFVAAALYLSNAGAGAQTYEAEWRAAMIYLAGSNWKKPYLRFYGDQVMDLAAEFQEQINLIKQSAVK